MNKAYYDISNPIKALYRLASKVTSSSEKKYMNRGLNQYGTLQKRVIGTGASATHKKKVNENSVLKKKMMSEYCISSALNHPNIIKTLDFVLDTKNRYCIIMEYCPEGDLYSWINEKKLVDLHDINDLFKQLLHGLSYLHNLGIAHRDIKPENLLIDFASNDSYRLKITDFGEAEVFRELFQTESRLSEGMCGSAPYIAPEIFNNSSYDASQADVWSAGIVYTCMRLKGMIFASARPSDRNYQRYKKIYKNYPVFDTLDKDSQYLLYAMLNPNPEKRFTVKNVLEMTFMANINVNQDLQSIA